VDLWASDLKRDGFTDNIPLKGCYVYYFRFLQSTVYLYTIRTQRERIERRMCKTPSLKTSLTDADWQADAWDDISYTSLIEAKDSEQA